jgi:hypothetical protein
MGIGMKYNWAKYYVWDLKKKYLYSLIQRNRKVTYYLPFAVNW